MPHILIFGDSITYGCNDVSGGWVQRLRDTLKEDDCVFNLGICGDTTEQVLNRLENELPQRLSDFKKNIIVFAVGVNDSSFSTAANQCQVPLDIFKQNLVQLIKLSREYSKNIIFIGAAPVDEAKVSPMPWALDLSYKNDLIKQYHQVIQSICSKEKVVFIDLFNYLKQDYISHLPDGVHPDAVGHQIIFKIIHNFLLKNAIII